MEPFPKRQRIYAPREEVYDHRFNDDLGYYDTGNTEPVEEDDEEETDEPIYDPEEDFQQKRAQLDYKLKSTFEGLFEKYGKDFDGIGDEIDLLTGEIIVNNGHLLDMQDERDAGEGRSRPARGHTAESLEDGDTSSSADALGYYDEDDEEEAETDEVQDVIYDDEDEDEDEDEEEPENDDSGMIDDDLILRQGFVQASSHLPRPQRKEPPPQARNWDAKDARSRLDMQSSSLPLKSQILNQFGPQLGPQIFDYISQKRAEEQQSHIEPAWRVPEIPSSSRRRSLPRSLAPTVQFEQPHSPEATTSLWAPVGTRKPRSQGIHHKNITLAGHKNARGRYCDADPLDPFDIRPISGLSRLGSHPVPRRVRNEFTPEEDEILLAFVADAKARRLPLRSESTWKKMGDLYPRHSSCSWMARYQRKFTYLDTDIPAESELSTSDISDTMDNMPNSNDFGRTHLSFADSMSVPTPHHPQLQRPKRIRKPAQRDSGIMSWYEAVNSIETSDPTLHRAILKDVRAGNDEHVPQSFSRNHFSIGEESFAQPQDEPRSEVELEDQRAQSPPEESANQSFRLRGQPSGMPGNPASHTQTTDSRHEVVAQSAPCPHVDCRIRPDALYLLSRRHGEEQSEMWQHLLRVHHTTPFPCGEIGCERKGERGYFSQAELVSHVRYAHPYPSALQRLRGRVDPELLSGGKEYAKHSSPVAHRSILEDARKRSVLVSPELNTHRIPPSSEISSSTPDHNQTMTPEATSSRIGPASTPKTSVSLLNAGPTASPEIATKRPWQLSAKTSDIGPHDHDKRSDFETINNAGSATQVHNHVRRSIDGDKAAASSPAVLPHAVERVVPAKLSVANPPTVTQSTSIVTPPSIKRRHKSCFGTRTIMNSRSSIPETPLGFTSSNSQPSLAIPTSSSPLSRSSARNHLSKVVEFAESASLARNVVDPWYDFSDDEAVNEPIIEPAAEPTKEPVTTIQPAKEPQLVMQPQPELEQKPLQEYAKQPSTVEPPTRVAQLLTDVSASTSKLQNITPAMRKKLQRSLRKTLDSQALDELSLGQADLVLISSRRRNRNVPLLFEPRIKDELEDTPSSLAALPIRKRRFSMLDNEDEVDELTAHDTGDLLKQTPARTSKVTDTKSISKAATTITPQNGVSSSNGLTGITPTEKKLIKTLNTYIASLPLKESSSAITASQRRILNRTPAPSTPLLDLTPEGKNDKRSTHTSKSKRDHPTSEPSRKAGLPTPPIGSAVAAGPSTRPRRKDAAAAAATAVLVRTPGGTLRRCGQDGFSCGRSFCFKCVGD